MMYLYDPSCVDVEEEVPETWGPPETLNEDELVCAACALRRGMPCTLVSETDACDESVRRREKQGRLVQEIGRAFRVTT
jgi:hypothetical protein